jgi:hypothetical protein
MHIDIPVTGSVDGRRGRAAWLIGATVTLAPTPWIPVAVRPGLGVPIASMPQCTSASLSLCAQISASLPHRPLTWSLAIIASLMSQGREPHAITANIPATNASLPA